jgi:hypothetical protein
MNTLLLIFLREHPGRFFEPPRGSRTVSWEQLVYAFPLV